MNRISRWLYGLDDRSYTAMIVALVVVTFLVGFFCSNVFAEDKAASHRPIHAASTRTAPAAASTRPDVLVVIWDDVGANDVDTIAAPPTPNLDTLAARGRRFTHCYSQPWCAPTRDAFLFGLTAGYYRGDACDGTVPSNAHVTSDRSIGDLFRAAGYSTGFFGKWHVGPVQGSPWQEAPQAVGFDVWRAGIASNVRTPACGQGSFVSWDRVDDGVVTHETRWADEVIRDEFLSWWASTPGPRFAVVAFQSAHEPYGNPPGVIPTASQQNRPRFKKMVEGLDLWLGQLVAVVGPETWIVLWGDNGTPGCNPVTGACTNSAAATGQDPFRLKLTTYEGGVRVPMIVAGGTMPDPGVPCDALVQPADVLATLAEGLGIPFVPIGESGAGSISFLSCIIDPASAGARPWAFCFDPGFDFDPAYVDRCVTEAESGGERWKLRVSAFDAPGLYELVLDPGELINLYGLGLPAQGRLEAVMGALP